MRYNASRDCAACADGFASYPACNCSRHAAGEVELQEVAALRNSRPSSQLHLLQEISHSLQDRVRRACGGPSVSETAIFAAFFYAMIVESAGARVILKFDVQALDSNCSDADRVTACVAQMLREGGCAAIVSVNDYASCNVTSVRTRQNSPCVGEEGCAAAANELIRRLTANEQVSPHGASTWVWALTGVGALLLFLLLIFIGVGSLRRLRVRRRGAYSFSDAGRYTKRFNIGVENQAALRGVDDAADVLIAEDMAMGLELEGRMKVSVASTDAHSASSSSSQLHWDSSDVD